MLKDTETLGKVSYNVSKMEECDLKSIYELEEVNFSDVHFIMRSKIDNENDRLFYCSISTHEESDFTSNERVLIKTNVDKIKKIFKDINEANESNR